MEKRGSITIFLALILSLLMSLLCTSIESVRMAAARTQILCSVDVGLYSLFGQYDKTALKDYDLFMIDGSCGGGALKMAGIYRNMESYMKGILSQNSQKLSAVQGGFTGYRLITDEGGEVFYHQITEYMKDTLGSQGAQLLVDRMQERAERTEDSRRKGEDLEKGNTLPSYEAEMNHAAANSRRAEEEQKRAAEQAAAGTPGGKPAVVTPGPKKKVKNPIGTIRRIMRRGLLELVVPKGSGISEEETEKNTLLSHRTLQTGMAMPGGKYADDSYLSGLLFQEYLMTKLGNYRKPAEKGLAYQLEYIICGKTSDEDNLLSVAEQLLVIREGVNLACIMADSVLRAQVEALSLAIASTFLVPPAAGVIEAALLLCWSFAESILDVRELLAGGKVPMVKKGAEWQLSLQNLAYLMDFLNAPPKKETSGLSYEDYLQILLLAKGKSVKLNRSMDMIEHSIRKKTGRENYRLDSQIVALEAAVDVKANKRNTFTVIRQYSYD